MTFLGQMSHGSGEPELLVGVLAIGFLVVCGVWALVRFVRRKPVEPDPWDESVATEIAEEDATPLCHRCLNAHAPEADFCPACGAAVGQYTNWLPYPYLFSVGHTLRIGTSGEFRRSPLTLVGFVLFSLVEYALFAPVYWIVMFWNYLERGPEDRAHAHPPPG